MTLLRFLSNHFLSFKKNLDDAELRGGARGVDSFLVQGREWEANGEYLRAAAAYLKVVAGIVVLGLTANLLDCGISFTLTFIGN